MIRVWLPGELSDKVQVAKVIKEQPKKMQQAVFMGEAEEQPDLPDQLFGDAQPGEGVGEAEGLDDEVAEEDAAPKLVSPDPGQPTQSEIDDHNVDHWPYRCWCEACVKGRGVGEAHKSEARRGGGSAVPVIAFDYLFVTSEHVWRREELTDEENDTGVLKVFTFLATFASLAVLMVIKTTTINENHPMKH